jgi:hypothetical protein
VRKGDGETRVSGLYDRAGLIERVSNRSILLEDGKSTVEPHQEDSKSVCMAGKRDEVYTIGIGMQR